MTFLLISIRLVETPNELVEQPEFKESYGTIVEEVKICDPTSKQYYAIYLIRRIVYAFLLISLSDYPTVQLCLTPVITIMPVRSLAIK